MMFLEEANSPLQMWIPSSAKAQAGHKEWGGVVVRGYKTEVGHEKTASTPHMLQPL